MTKQVDTSIDQPILDSLRVVSAAGDNLKTKGREMGEVIQAEYKSFAGRKPSKAVAFSALVIRTIEAFKVETQDAIVKAQGLEEWPDSKHAQYDACKAELVSKFNNPKRTAMAACEKVTGMRVKYDRKSKTYRAEKATEKAPAAKKPVIEVVLANIKQLPKDAETKARLLAAIEEHFAA